MIFLMARKKILWNTSLFLWLPFSKLIGFFDKEIDVSQSILRIVIKVSNCTLLFFYRWLFVKLSIHKLPCKSVIFHGCFWTGWMWLRWECTICIYECLKMALLCQKKPFAIGKLRCCFPFKCIATEMWYCYNDQSIIQVLSVTKICWRPLCMIWPEQFVKSLSALHKLFEVFTPSLFQLLCNQIGQFWWVQESLQTPRHVFLLYITR